MPKILDPVTFPLSGVSLIEASAGTGKTYTITNLVLRLILGHGCQPQPIHKILLVTFTNAATAELRQRIRKKIQGALLDFYAEQSEDPVVRVLLEQSSNLALSILRLSVAQRELDKATIYTIHGFCQRVLQEHAFESGMGYQQALILDENEYLRLAVKDFWRNEVANLTQQRLAIVLSLWRSPEELLSEVRPWLVDGVTPSAEIKALNKLDIDQLLAEYQRMVGDLKLWWVSADIHQLLSETKFNGRHTISKVALYDAMTDFCNSQSIDFSFNKGGWDLFSTEKVKKALTKASIDFDLIPFEQFDALHRIQQQCLTLVHLFYVQKAIAEVQARLSRQKTDLNLLSPDDLLKQMRRALTDSRIGASDRLKKAVLEQYPVAIIDEFQDTDPIQYKVFSSLYVSSQETEEQPSTLIMIGDPKQAIYAFRGADIYTYIEAKNDASDDNHFTLNTNWRSQPEMVAAVNQLFLYSPKPFLLQQGIQFSPVEAGRPSHALEVNGEPIHAMAFMTLTDSNGSIEKPMNWGAASFAMAKQTAIQIASWLEFSRYGHAKIENAPLSADDFCVLVRDRSEAELIQMALYQQGVNSVFLIRKSVFSTDVAADLLVLLQGIHQCENESAVKSALLTSLVGVQGDELDRLLVDDAEWQRVLQRFAVWRNNWQFHGLMQAVNHVIGYFSIGNNLLSHFDDGSRRLTDLRHLIELLQSESSRIQGETQLLRWYQQQVSDPDHNSESQQLRLDSDANLVKIVTLHSAKGLEYPIVFMPFVCRYKSAKIGLYHDDNKGLVADYRINSSAVELADEERLAEDLRLLYVGLTRAKFHCSVGVWHANTGGNSRASGIGRSALGYLLLSGTEREEGSVSESVLQALGDLEKAGHTQVIHFNTDDIAGIFLKNSNVLPDLPEHQEEAPHLNDYEGMMRVAELEHLVMQSWQMTSYSALSKQQHNLQKPLDEDLMLSDTLKLDEGVRYEMDFDDEALDRYSFPRGASAGTFLHSIMEVLTFDDLTQLDDTIEQKMQWFGIEGKWQALLKQWVTDILSCPLGIQTNHCLADLSSNHYLPEMEFYLPLNQMNAKSFNRLLNEKTAWGNREYQFNELTGILKGFIDLVYEVDGQYFVADYKSNHLGGAPEYYEQHQLRQAMEAHDYHLQGVIYTLALHRWLKQRLQHYDYDQHVGGAVYLFLRGMNPDIAGSGVYYFKPDKVLITALDDLFSGQVVASTENYPSSQETGQQLGLDFESGTPI